MKIRWKPQIEKDVNENILLVISPFEKEIKRVTRATAEKRNKMIIEISNKIIVGYKTENGQLDKLLNGKNYELL